MDRRLRVPTDVAACVRGLHPELKAKVRAGLEAIQTDHLAGKPLQDVLAGLRSHRVGRLRIIYRTVGQVIEIVAIGPRKTIYEETWRRIRKR
jgi:mRNA interferase RelE/StbE